eukprot:405663_1
MSSNETIELTLKVGYICEVVNHEDETLNGEMGKIVKSNRDSYDLFFRVLNIEKTIPLSNLKFVKDTTKTKREYENEKAMRQEKIETERNLDKHKNILGICAGLTFLCIFMALLCWIVFSWYASKTMQTLFENNQFETCINNASNNKLIGTSLPTVEETQAMFGLLLGGALFSMFLCCLSWVCKCDDCIGTVMGCCVVLLWISIVICVMGICIDLYSFMEELVAQDVCTQFDGFDDAWDDMVIVNINMYITFALSAFGIVILFAIIVYNKMHKKCMFCC